MKAKFIIDSNLPYYFGMWNSEDFIHQNDIDPKANDGQIWNYAKRHDLVVITKDADFSNRLILDGPPPKVIHVRFGNMKIKEFHQHMSIVWDKLIPLIDQFDLLNVFKDKVEGISLK